MSAPKDPEKYDAWRKKLSEKAKLRGNNGNSMKGYNHSKEAKDKIAKAASESTKRYLSLLTQEEMSQRMKNITRGRRNQKEIWDSLTREEQIKILEKLHNPKYEDTRPELIFEQMLKDKHLIYVKQKMVGSYRVDFFIPKSNTIFEIFGCFWHQCESCGFVSGYKDRSFKDIHQYDARKINFLKENGFLVNIVWEHQLIHTR